LTVSVETLAWAGVIAASGFILLADLNGLPFSTDEAARSLDALRAGEGEVPDGWRGDFAAALTSYLFRVFGPSETLARVVPALAALGMVGSLWWLRPYAGKAGALVAAILIVLSPLFVLESRAANAFALGPLLSVVMVASLFNYLRDPRTASAFPLIVSLATALVADASVMLTLVAVIIFSLLEALAFRSHELASAFRVFRSSAVQWVSAILVVAAVIQLGFTRFGISVHASLPGPALLGDMFQGAGTARPAEYFAALLVAYEWPLLVGGAAGFVLLAARLAGRRGMSGFDRFLLIWTVAGALALAMAARKEGTQLLVLIPPLALLSGRVAEEFVQRVDLGGVQRWWPAAVAVLAVMALAALLMSEWSSGNASAGERALLAAAPIGCLAILAFLLLRERSAAAAVALAGLSIGAIAFLTHSTLAVAFGGGSEFAVDSRLTPRVEQLRSTLERLSEERNSPIVLDSDLRDELGWVLRDSDAIFGAQPGTASIIVSKTDAAPPGFEPLPDVWRLSEGWYPDEVLAPRRMWRWLLFREPFGALDVADARIYVRTI
jgi:hypothetical protein